MAGLARMTAAAARRGVGDGGGGRVIAVGNLKGGVGKSTLAINLACAYAARGLASVVIDTDPQQTAAAWTRRRRLPCHVHAHPIRAGLDGAAALGPAIEGWLDAVARARTLCRRVVIDLPATLSPVLAAAFLAADLVLIPTSPSPVDLEATRRTVRRARVAAAERGTDGGAGGPAILVVPVLADRDWLGRAKAPSLHHRALEAETAAPIGYDPAFARAFDRSDWIGGHAPGSRAHREIKALADLAERTLRAAG